MSRRAIGQLLAVVAVSMFGGAAILADAARDGAGRLPRDNLLVYHNEQDEVRPVRSVEDWQRRRAEIVRGMETIMGKLPVAEKRCPLDMIIEEEVDCGGYVRRLISYASEPGSRVPAYLLVPKAVLTGNAKAPAVLCLHGTDNVIGHGVVVGLGGKPHRQYAAELAERGYVTLAPSYPLLAKYQPNLKELGWQSGTLKAVWDNMRGLDLLESLPFVQRGRFGAIGHSLGGHNSVYTAVFDSRIQAIASSCGLDSFLDYYRGDEKVWMPEKGWCQTRYMLRLADYRGRLEEIPFDFHELIGALAPRHVFISAPLKDSNFRHDSVDRIAAAASQVYRLYGQPDRLRVEHPDCEHDFPDAMRAAAYQLFDNVLARKTPAAPQGDHRAKGPNFLVILCDDLGYGDPGCFGNKTIQTPNLDRLATQGMRLTDCYAAAPVCSPSRVGLLTGRTPYRVGVYDWIPADHPMHMGRAETTIATLLKRADYSTCHVGKWHCNGKFNSPEQPQPGDHGFDHWFSTQNNAAPTHHNPTNFVRNGEPAGPLEGYSCQVVADEAIRWLREREDKSKPFFQFVCFHEPHEPVDSPPELVSEYPEATKRGEALYYANVTNMDRAVGRLMAALDELRLADDTFVYFSSDNGPETLNRYAGAWRSHGSAGPLRGMKLHIYEGGIRVPGIIRWPGHTKPGQVVNEPICSTDLLPTFCELAGAKVPADRPIDGTSILPIFQGKPIERKTPLYWHYFRAFGKPKVAMREGDWKILGHWSGPDLGPGGSVHPGDQELIKTAKLVNFELYNLRDDIAEQHDLAAHEPQRLGEMSSRLVKLYGEIQKEGPVWELPDKK